jgi:hypothetical protein
MQVIKIVPLLKTNTNLGCILDNDFALVSEMYFNADELVMK